MRVRATIGLATMAAFGGTSLLLAAEAPAPDRDRPTLRLLGDSSEEWSRHWERRSFRKTTPTRYSLVEDEATLALRGDSRAAASIVWRKVDLDGSPADRLSWRWKVEGSLEENGAERTASGDDYTARVFVFFGEKLLGRGTRALCYVWAGREPVGSTYPNPSVDGVVTVVLRSGDSRAGEWVGESRDVAEDYRRAFGDGPAKLAGVAFMVDTDDTGSTATAWLDRLVLDRGAPPAR